MSTNGRLEVSDNVAFMANSAGADGGAVRPPLEILHENIIKSKPFWQ